MSGKFKQWIDRFRMTRFTPHRGVDVGVMWPVAITLDRIDFVWAGRGVTPDEKSYSLEVWHKEDWLKLQDTLHVKEGVPYNLGEVIWTHKFRPVRTSRIRLFARWWPDSMPVAKRISAWSGRQRLAVEEPPPDPKLKGTPEDSLRAFHDHWRTIATAAERAIVPDTETRKYERFLERIRLLAENIKDVAGQEILAKGEPTFRGPRKYFPPISFASTVIGMPGHLGRSRVDWNSALLMDMDRRKKLLHSDWKTHFERMIFFAVGPEAEPYGTRLSAYRNLRLEKGYLPIVHSRYFSEGIEYSSCVFAWGNSVEGKGDVDNFVRFKMENQTACKKGATLWIKLRRFPFESKPSPLSIDPTGRRLLEGGKTSALFSHRIKRAGKDSFRIDLALPSGGSREALIKIPSGGPRATVEDSDAPEPVLRKARRFWAEFLESGAVLDVPEKRVRDAYRATRIALFLSTDNTKNLIHYGSCSLYDGTLYYIENPHACVALAELGYHREAQMYLAGMDHLPEFVDPKYSDYFQQPGFRGWWPYYVNECYRLTRDKRWLAARIDSMRRKADAIVTARHKELGRKGLMPKSYYGGDVSDAKVDALISDIQACLGVQSVGLALEELGDQKAAQQYLDEANDHHRAIEKAMKSSIVRRKGLPEAFPFMRDFKKSRYGPDLEPVFRSPIFSYVNIFASIILSTWFFKPDSCYARIMMNFMENGGGIILGMVRVFGRQFDNTYGYGYLKNLLQNGHKDKFLLGFYSNLAINYSRLFQAVEHWDFFPHEKYGLVEGKMLLNVCETHTMTIRAIHNMFVLADEDLGRATGIVRIGMGLPDAWLKTGRAVSLRNVRTPLGKMSVCYLLQGKHLNIDIELEGNPRECLVRVSHPDRRKIAKVHIDGVRKIRVSRDALRIKSPPSSLHIEVLFA